MRNIIVLILCLVLSSQGLFAQKKDKKGKEKGKQQPTEIPVNVQVQRQNTARFIEAVKERLNGNPAQAEKLLLEVIAKEPSHDAARYEYAKILLGKNYYSTAVTELEKAISFNNANIWYKVLLAQTYDQTGQFASSEKLWAEIIKLEPQNIEYLYYYSLSLIYQNKLKEAVAAYNLIEIQIGVNEEITNAKKSIWLHLDKVDEAAKEMEKLAIAYPFESKYYLDIADLYITNKMLDKAVPYFKKAEKADPNNPKINVSLYNYYTENKKYDEAFGYLKKAFLSPDLPLDEKVKIIMGYYNSPKDSEKAYQLLDNLVIAHPDDPIAWSVYADFMVRDKRLKEAKAAFEKVISRDDSKFKVWEQYLAILLDMNEWDETYKQSLVAMSLFPTQALPYLAHGMASSFRDEYENAVSALKEGKKYATEEYLMLQINFFLAETYNQMKDFENSDKYYEELIEKYPRNPTFLNNYSYSLSKRDYRIEYALQLAKKAVELSPNTAYLEDTYAWAFFKNQDYKNAKLWLEKALKNGGTADYDILIHYSQVLEILGDTKLSEEYRLKAEQLKAKGTQ